MGSTEDEEYGFGLLEYDPQIGPGNPPPLSSYSTSTEPTKPSSRVLSFFLQAAIMALVVSLFFLFLGIASLVLLHICIAGRALRRRRHNRGGGDAQLRLASATGLSAKEVQRLPSCCYGPQGAAADCPVCLEGFKDGERCRLLPSCRHVFHAECVDRWLMKMPACPVCRAVVPRPPVEGEGPRL